ncbi:MAG: polyprenyl synthetase family protein [Nitrospirota bacterium]
MGTEGVFEWMEGFLGSLPIPAEHRELLAVHVEEGRAQAASCPEFPSIRVPLLVHAGVAGDEERAVPLAGACAFVYLGADLLDNLADDELPARWRGRTPAEASLAACTFLSVLPYLALSRLDAPPGRIQVLTGLFAEGLLSMSAGQHEDLLASRGEGVTPPACRAMVERKSGAETALFARSAAVLAGADPAVADSYGAFGLCLGAGAQIGSDLGDIFDPGGSRDLLNGKLTLPIVHALTVLKDRDREAFLRLLDSARQSIEPHEEARKVLMRAGSVRYTALVIEVYRQKALSHLAAAPVSGGGFAGHAGKALRSLVDGISLAGRGTAAGLAICFR